MSRRPEFCWRAAAHRALIQVVFGLLVCALGSGSGRGLAQSAGSGENPPGSTPLASTPLGVVEGFWRPDDACALGVSWERIIFDWAQHQPDGPDSWNTLNVDDRWLQAAADCGREVVAIIKHTPAWATDGTPGIGVPRGLELPADDPGNLWAVFMARAAEYYAPRGVSRFIIWNEPDIPAGTYGYEFEGSVEDYARLVQVAALAAKGANPAARIHLAGVTYWHDVNVGQRLYLDRLLEVLTAQPDAAANGAFFDVVTLHLYFRTDSVYTITRETRDLLARYGLGDKEVWIGETNASPNRDPLWPVVRPNWQVTLDQQADFLVQAAALGLAAGADHIGVYKLYDQSLPAGAESFGLMRADGSRRPAFETWRLLAEQLRGVTETTFAQSATLDAVRMRRSDGQVLWVLWARTEDGALVRLALPARQTARQTAVMIFNSVGGMMETTAQVGSLTLMLPGATCNRRDGCAVGGSPALILLPDEAVSGPDAANSLVELDGTGTIPLTFIGAN